MPLLVKVLLQIYVPFVGRTGARKAESAVAGLLTSG
jgi:hypothetical protein